VCLWPWCLLGVGLVVRLCHACGGRSVQLVDREGGPKLQHGHPVCLRHVSDRASVVFHQPFGVPGASRGLPDLLLQRAHPLCELRQGEGSHDHRQSPLWPHLHRGGWASSGSRGVSQGREERR
ncbi:unnamed protein product, partial [Symbiodinium microadriaticum]